MFGLSGLRVPGLFLGAMISGESRGVGMAHVQAFLVLSEELHFSRAARRLNVSQPRISRLIAALERQVGGKLFERTSRRVTLTPLGQQLDAELRPAYEQVRAALDHIRHTAFEAAGQLSPDPGSVNEPRRRSRGSLGRRIQGSSRS